jgi:hypothetical protein
MAATVPVAFDPDPENLAGGSPKTFIATSAILRGQVVAFSDTGVSRSVVPATSSTGAPIGVAATSQATAGGEVGVYMNGCVVKVMQSTDNGTIDAGHYVTVSAVAGCVIEMDPAILAHVAVLSTGLWPVGITIEDIAAGAATVGGTGYILINCVPMFSLAS